MGIFTRGYPFPLSGNGYGKKLYPLAGMGTGDGSIQMGWVRVWGGSTHAQTLRVPALVLPMGHIWSDGTSGPLTARAKGGNC